MQIAQKLNVDDGVASFLVPVFVVFFLTVSVVEILFAIDVVLMTVLDTVLFRIDVYAVADVLVVSVVVAVLLVIIVLIAKKIVSEVVVWFVMLLIVV